MDSTALLMASLSSSFLANSPNPKFTHVPTAKPASPPIVRTLHSRHPNLIPPKPISRNRLSCSAVTTPHLDASGSDNLTTADAKLKLQHLVQEFQSLIDPIDRVKKLLHYADEILPQYGDSLKTTANRVPGCTAQVWIHVELDFDNRLKFWADSDSEITKGFCACLVWVLDGATPEEVLAVNTEDLEALNVAGLNGYSSSRSNTWHNVLMSMQKRTKALVAQRQGLPLGDLFPSLIVTADGIEAKGSYAEAQARFLLPDEVKIQELVHLLEEKKIGVVAHFYMDPEVQGVLTAAQKHWPHIHISDSLVMADSAVKMAKGGCKFITVLGVDFMSENVRAILDQAGFSEVGVYRMSAEQIGCSLADAAASPGYMDYLSAAGSVPSPSLHVVYINTSLETKAFTHEIVPTITCTSSNVVQTILQAFAEVPNLTVWYGPDTYMGANIMELFKQMTVMSDEEIASVHPKHNRNSIKSLIPRLYYFQDGTCIVHHLFGHEVVGRINEMYCDAFITAHFEVPGEMFSLAMEAKRRGMGVVGSTQNILDFIKERLQEALDRDTDDHLQFVLGTESGMVTSIVSTVKRLLGSVNAHEGPKVSVEIVFPVSSESISRKPSTSSGEAGDDFSGLKVIPGVASGEGCSLHGGCASCPYMKMNSLDSLLQICRILPDDKGHLSVYEAGRFSLRTPSGKLIADVGCEPILHMRHFQATKKLPEKLVQQILDSGGNGR